MDCDLKVNIFEEKSEYKYTLSSTERKTDGLLALAVEGDNVFLDFKGLFIEQPALAADDPPSTVSGMLLGNVTDIQNYGNSTIQYIKFSDCSQKYLELTAKSN